MDKFCAELFACAVGHALDETRVCVCSGVGNKICSTGTRVEHGSTGPGEETRLREVDVVWFKFKFGKGAKLPPASEPSSLLLPAGIHSRHACHACGSCGSRACIREDT